MSYTRYTTAEYVVGETNADARSPEYAAWCNMVTRCYNKNRVCWRSYGGRGIRVVARWHDYKNFLADMGRMPGDRLTLDRLDSNGNYSKENCKWVTRAHNATHTSRVKQVSAFGETKTCAEWARDARCPGLRPIRIYNRIWNGWDPATAITTPTKSQKERN